MLMVVVVSRAVTVEDHFHIFNHTASENVMEFRSHPGMFIGLCARQQDGTECRAAFQC